MDPPPNTTRPDCLKKETVYWKGRPYSYHRPNPYCQETFAKLKRIPPPSHPPVDINDYLIQWT